MRFVFRSLLILLALYGIVFAVGDVYLARSGAPLWMAVPGVPLAGRVFPDIVWDDGHTDLPAANREFYGGTPNAFPLGGFARTRESW